MKTAIIYDWMDKWGGVERLLLTLNEEFPDADWYTSYIDRENASWTKYLSGEVYPSFLQKFPDFLRRSRIFSLFLLPYAFESFDLSKYDLVISVTSSFAKGVITRPETKHICILLTPTRWLWGMTEQYVSSSWAVPFLSKLRKWDFVAAQRPDRIISISQHVAERCRTYYKRDSDVVYPPFDTEHWDAIEETVERPERPYFLTVSRLESYKKVDLVVKAFTQLQNYDLVVVGRGSQKKSLQHIASKNTTFLENVSDIKLRSLYRNAEALIMPQEEDFGYVSVEAQYFGCPVISYRTGGVAELIEDGKTGCLFDSQNVSSVREAVADFKRDTYNLVDTKGIARKFAKETFIYKLHEIISKK
ncbi:glycosyltransferase [Candidatus Roizmanbacteria bacterium]|nr:MAG: glycosyltransferase [Candidatus Roizmanbacteria bacterium]